MAVLQMQKVSICALKKDRKAILEKIQSMGVMEISKVLDDDSGFERMNTQNERSKFEKNASLADMALDIFFRNTCRKRCLCSPVWKAKS